MSHSQWFGLRKPSRRDDIVARLVALASLWAISSWAIQLLFLVLVVPRSDDAVTFIVYSRNNVGSIAIDRGLVAVVGIGVATIGLLLARASRNLWHSQRKGGESLAGLAFIIAAFSVFVAASGAVDYFGRDLQFGPGMWNLLPSALGWSVMFSMVTVRRARKRKGAHVKSA